MWSSRQRPKFDEFQHWEVGWHLVGYFLMPNRISAANPHGCMTCLCFLELSTARENRGSKINGFPLQGSYVLPVDIFFTISKHPPAVDWPAVEIQKSFFQSLPASIFLGWASCLECFLRDEEFQPPLELSVGGGCCGLCSFLIRKRFNLHDCLNWFLI